MFFSEYKYPSLSLQGKSSLKTLLVKHITPLSNGEG